MRIFLWHVHGSWTTAFVQGEHEYFVPVLPGRPADGLGRAASWDWPTSVAEVGPDEARELDVDVLILQRESELEHLARAWLGREPGRDVPAVYLEHNAPEGSINQMRHPAADRRDLHIAHVTHFNRLFWDTGATPTRVIEHGVVDPGHRYRGLIGAAGVVVNDPISRGRVVGLDLLAELGRAAPIQLFGMGTEPLGGVALSQSELHGRLAMLRVYLHPYRWTSLGLSLIEAMHLGMPVVALATTETAEILPPTAGIVSNRIEQLQQGLRTFLADRDAAEAAGAAAREVARERFSLERFLAEWGLLLKEAVA